MEKLEAEQKQRRKETKKHVYGVWMVGKSSHSKLTPEIAADA